MATYNQENYVAQAIESVLAQTYDGIELIVIDDCSADRTADIVDSYVRNHPGRVRLLSKQMREGPCKARGEAFAHATGSLICWLDGDDLWMPSKVEQQVELMRERPEVGLVYTYFDAFDSATGKTVPWGDARRDFEGDVLAPLVAEGCFIGSLTVMFRRQALDSQAIRWRDRDFSFGDDYYLWLAIAINWQVARIPCVLARYRRHTTNESTRNAESNASGRQLALLEEFFAEFPEASEALGRWRHRALARQGWRAARTEANKGNLAGASAWCVRAFCSRLAGAFAPEPGSR